MAPAFFCFVAPLAMSNLSSATLVIIVGSICTKMRRDEMRFPPRTHTTKKKKKKKPIIPQKNIKTLILASRCYERDSRTLGFRKQKQQTFSECFLFHRNTPIHIQNKSLRSLRQLLEPNFLKNGEKMGKNRQGIEKSNNQTQERRRRRRRRRGSNQRRILIRVSKSRLQV